MCISIRHIWYQKHPTPGDPGTGFKYYPEASGEERIALGRLWQFPFASVLYYEESLAIWARTFETQVPGEGRSYHGRVAAILQPVPGGRSLAAALPSALGDLKLAPAMPHSTCGKDPALQTDTKAKPAQGILPFPGEHSVGHPATAKALARAILWGGVVRLPDAGCDSLPADIGKALSWLPASARSEPRVVRFVTGKAERQDDDSKGARGVAEHYLALSWTVNPALRGHARAIWHCLELVMQRYGTGPEALFKELLETADAFRAGEPSNLSSYLIDRGILQGNDLASSRCGAPVLQDESTPRCNWNRVLNRWRLGKLTNTEDGESTQRISRVIVFRALVDYLQWISGDAPEINAPRYQDGPRFDSLIDQKHANLLNEAVDELLGPLRDLSWCTPRG